jgi:hypothetical protein
VIRTVKAVVDEQGNVKLLEPVKLSGKRQALVTILEEEYRVPATMLLSEAALAKDWDRPEEDEAWANL